MFYGVLGAVIGGRLGHVLFYGLPYYLANPLHIFHVWEGGMAFHGGLIGVLVACAIYARRKSLRFLDLMDFVAPLVPLGLAAGRLGNFINGELWGRVTSVPWGGAPAACSRNHRPAPYRSARHRWAGLGTSRHPARGGT